MLISSVFRGPGLTPAGGWPRQIFYTPPPAGAWPRQKFLPLTPAGVWPGKNFDSDHSRGLPRLIFVTPPPAGVLPWLTFLTPTPAGADPGRGQPRRGRGFPGLNPRPRKTLINSNASEEQTYGFVSSGARGWPPKVWHLQNFVTLVPAGVWPAKIFVPVGSDPGKKFWPRPRPGSYPG